MLGRLLAVVLVMSAPSAVLGDDRAAAREHYQKGTKAFALGAYDEAIAEYSAAYRLKDDPALLYNIAQSHRLAMHAAEALRFYKMYLLLLPKAANRSEVENKIAELQKLVDQQKKTATAMPPDSVKQPPEMAQPETESEQRSTMPRISPQVETSPAPEQSMATPLSVPDARPGRTKKIAGLAAAAVGVAVLVPGVALSALAKTYEGDLVAQYDPGKESTGNTFGVVGPVMVGLGSAAAVAGIVLLSVGVSEARRARAVSVVPAFGATGLSATVKVSF